jgi:hypothetical protein
MISRSGLDDGSRQVSSVTPKSILLFMRPDQSQGREIIIAGWKACYYVECHLSLWNREHLLSVLLISRRGQREIELFDRPPNVMQGAEASRDHPTNKR